MLRSKIPYALGGSLKSLKALVAPFTTPLLFVVGLSSAVATTVTLTDVNLKVAALTAPFNTADTVMNFAFTSLTVDAVRTLDFGFTGLVSKRGSVNDAKVEFKKARYAFGDGTEPTVDLDVRIDFDIVKALGQTAVNDFAKDLDKMAVDAAQDFAKDYGPAATVDATILDKVVDAQGNVESMKLKLSAVMDFSKLPTTKPVNEVEFQSIDILVVAEKTGFGVTLNFVANPLYKGFETTGTGLKEYVEKLLNDDKQTYDDLQKYLGMLDGLAGWLVEMKPQP